MRLVILLLSLGILCCDGKSTTNVYVTQAAEANAEAKPSLSVKGIGDKGIDELSTSQSEAKVSVKTDQTMGVDDENRLFRDD